MRQESEQVPGLDEVSLEQLKREALVIVEERLTWIHEDIYSKGIWHEFGSRTTESVICSRHVEVAARAIETISEKIKKLDRDRSFLMERLKNNLQTLLMKIEKIKKSGQGSKEKTEEVLSLIEVCLKALYHETGLNPKDNYRAVFQAIRRVDLNGLHTDHDWQRLAESLRTFEVDHPIIIRDDKAFIEELRKNAAFFVRTIDYFLSGEIEDEGEIEERKSGVITGVKELLFQEEALFIS